MIYADYIEEYMAANPGSNAIGCIVALGTAYFMHRNKEKISDIINKIKS